MFTGIVAETGTVNQIEHGTRAIRLTIATHTIARGLKLGDSVAVNGCCLTAVKISARGKVRRITTGSAPRRSWSVAPRSKIWWVRHVICLRPRQSRGR